MVGCFPTLSGKNNERGLHSNACLTLCFRPAGFRLDQDVRWRRNASNTLVNASSETMPGSGTAWLPTST